MADHKNGVTSDNRIENIREANPAQNSHNRKNGKVNKTGYPGVTYLKRKKVYVAESTTNNVRKHLGTFRTAEDAAAAYEAHLVLARGEFLYKGNETSH